MESWTVRKLEPGDRIRVDRGAYFHHGIYAGEGEVIHFCAEGGDGIDRPEEVTVRRTPIADFTRGGFCEVMEYRDKRRRRSPGEIVEYADSCIGRGGYDILNYNCEHFANECVFGEAYSQLVDDTREKVRALLRKKQDK